MNKSKYFVLFLLITAICLVSFGAVLAEENVPILELKISKDLKIMADPKNGKPPADWCEECCASEYGEKGQCTGCNCGGGSKGGAEPPVIYIRPSDEIGEYYINDKDGKDYVSFKSWNNCMQYFGDADKCSKIVTDPCESCMGTCLDLRSKGFKLSATCSVICRSECAKTGSEGEE